MRTQRSAARNFFFFLSQNSLSHLKIIIKLISSFWLWSSPHSPQLILIQGVSLPSQNHIEKKTLDISVLRDWPGENRIAHIKCCVTPRTCPNLVPDANQSPKRWIYEQCPKQHHSSLSSYKPPEQ